MNKRTLLFPLGLAVISIILFSAPSQAGKKEIEAIEKLQGEVTVLQRQVRDLQQSFDRSNGQIVTLIGQMSDNVATATRSITTMKEALSDTQARINGSFTRVESRFTALETNLRATSERLTHISDQLAGLKEVVAQFQKRSQTSIDPTDPIQLFSSAYSDYLRGNYELAIDQFSQFTVRFPALETTDDAYYWIAECLYNLGRQDEALAQYQKVTSEFMQSNKLAAAQLKKGLVLLQLNRQKEAIAELRTVVKTAPVEEPKPTKSREPQRRKPN
jgi:TolA-binding protein